MVQLVAKMFFYPFTIADKLYKMGHFGQKTKKGYYDYSKNRRGKSRSTIINLIKEVRKEKAIVQRKFNVEDIEQRLIYSLINEGMHCLEEKIASRPIDIDVILMFGYGFPPQLGGPMFYCDEIGLKNICKKIEKFRIELPENPYWKESSLFKKCATKNIGIHKYYKYLMKNKARL